MLLFLLHLTNFGYKICFNLPLGNILLLFPFLNPICVTQFSSINNIKFFNIKPILVTYSQPIVYTSLILRA